MITTLFFFLVTIALWHVLYEAVFLPMFRLQLRFKLFKLRDELRMLRSIHGQEISPEIYSYLQMGINTTLKLLHKFSIYSFINTRKTFEANPKLKKEIDAKASMFDACNVDDIRHIKDATTNVAFYAFVANSGGWAIYIVPFVVVHFLASTVKRWARGIAYTPASEVPRLETVMG